MSLVAAATFARVQTHEVHVLLTTIGRASASVDQASRTLAAGPDVTVTVGPGADRSAEIYRRFFTLIVPGLTLPGYAIDPRALEHAVGFDPDLAAFVLSLNTLIRRSPEPARGLRL